MVRLHHGVSVTCDQCGDGPAGPGTAVHYPDEATALALVLAAGWQTVAEGRLLCPVCAPILTCEVEGHELTDWQRPVPVSGGPAGSRCGCDPHAPVHRLGSDQCGREFRYCRRCCVHESRLRAGQVVA